MIIYLESSAATKLVLAEAETQAMKSFLDAYSADGYSIVSSALLETDLRRAALRAGATQFSVTQVLDRLDLIDVDRATFAAAGLLPDAALRSVDALHIASALRVGARLFVSYDERQSAAASASGLHVVAPV